MNRHINNGLAVLVGQVAAALGGLIGVRILTEYLSPDEYGHLTLGLTLALVVNQLLIGPLGAGVTRFYSAASEKKELIEFFVAMLRLLFVVIVAVVLITILAVVMLWTINIKGWIVMVAIAAIFSVVSGLNSIINGLWLGNNQQVVLSLNQGLEPWIRIIGSITAIVLIKASGQTAFAGYIVGVFLLLLSQCYLIRRYGIFSGLSSCLMFRDKLECASVWTSRLFSYAYPFAIWGIFTTLHLASDRWILHWHHGTEEVGYFAVLYQIGYMPMTLLTSMGAQLLTPILFSIAGDGSNDARINRVSSVTNRSIWVALLLISLAAFIGWLFSDLVLSLLAAEQYRKLHSYLPLFLIAGGLFGVGQLAALKLQSMNRMSLLLVIKIVSALTGIVANFILGFYYGALGIGISLIIFATIYMLWIFMVTGLRGRNHEN